MSSLLTHPTLLILPGSISWRSLTPRIVEVAIDLANGTDEPIEAGQIEIAAAPLGAFVPSRPVARVAVEALEPGRRRRVTARVERRELPAPATGFGKLFANMPGIDAEMLELLDRAAWDGNIHVSFEEGPTVEVHRALDIPVSVGQAAAATLFTGPETTELTVDVRSRESWLARTVSMCGLALLIVSAPDVASRAQVVVNVTQVASGRTVPVEFEFEAR